MNSPISNLKIQELHKKYAASKIAYDLVYTHCVIVKKIVDQLLEKNHLPVDYELVTTGALLHDIGAYKLIDSKGTFDEKNYITHGIKGATILRDEHIAEPICRFADHHTGVGISKEEIIQLKLPLPVADYFAETLEEELIMYADKFHSKTPQFNAYETYKQKISIFGSDKSIKFEHLAEKFGIPELSELSKEYSMPIV